MVVEDGDTVIETARMPRMVELMKIQMMAKLVT
jgi:hypothetical protein